MKRILFFILFIPFIAKSQDDSTKYINYRFEYGKKMARVMPDSVLHTPYLDTTFKPVRSGALTTRPADNLIYWWNGVKWNLFGSGTGGTFDTTTIYSNIALKLNKSDSSVASGYYPYSTNPKNYLIAPLDSTNIPDLHSEAYYNTKYSSSTPIALNSAHILVGNGSNVATDVNPTLSANMGNYGLSNTGVFTYPFLRNGLDVIPSGIAKFGSSNNRGYGFYSNNARAMHIDSTGKVYIDTAIIFRPLSTSISFFNPPPSPTTLPYISFGSTITRVEPKNISWVYQSMGLRWRDLQSTDMKTVMNSVHGLGYFDGDGTQELYAYMPYGGEWHWYTMKNATDTLASDMGFVSNKYDWQLLRNITIRYNAALSQSDTMGINIGNAFTGSHQPDPGTLQMGLRLSFLALANRARINAGVDSVGYGTLGNKYALELQDEGGQLFIGRGKIDGYIPDDSAKVQINGNLVIGPKVTGFPYGYLGMHIGQSGSGSDVFPDIGFNNVHTTVTGRWKYGTGKASSLIHFPNGAIVFKGTNVAGSTGATIAYNDFMTIDNTGKISAPYISNGGTATDSVLVVDPTTGLFKKRSQGLFGSISAGWGLTGTTTFKVDTSLVASLYALNDSARILRSLIGSGGGGSVSFGTSGQMPYMNSGGTDFNYSSHLKWDATNKYLYVGDATVTPTGGIVKIAARDAEGKVSFVYATTEYGFFKVNTATGSFGLGSAQYPLDFYGGGTFRFWDNNLNLYRSVAAGTGDIRLNVGYGSTAYAYVDANTGTGVSSIGSDNYPLKINSVYGNVFDLTSTLTTIKQRVQADSLIKYKNNYGSAFDARTLVDKNYVDSARNKARDSVVALLSSGGALANTSDSTWKLTKVGDTIKISPYSAKKGSNPGYAYYYNGTSNPSYVNRINLDGWLYTGLIASHYNGLNTSFLTASIGGTDTTGVLQLLAKRGSSTNGSVNIRPVYGLNTTNTWIIPNDATIDTAAGRTWVRSLVASNASSIQNVGNGDTLLKSVSADTVGVKSLKFGSTSARTVTDTTITINIASGTYTPTVSGGSNVASSSANANVMYTKVGNVVTVSGQIQVTPTASGQVSWNIDLPVTTANFSATTQAGGVGSYVNGSSVATAKIVANSGAQTVGFVYRAPDTAVADISFTFQYTIQ